MRRIFLLPICLAFACGAMAQTAPMTLDECMRYAVEHSTAVNKQLFTNDTYRQDVTEALASLFPSVDARVNTSNNYGRSIDPETNAYTTTSTFSNGYSVSGSMPVFAGFSNINTLRAARVGRLMGKQQLEQARDEVSLEVMRAYFDVVYYTDCVKMAAEQAAASRSNWQKNVKLEELGLKSAADVAQLESQAAADEYQLVSQENNRDLAMLTLRKAMNWPEDEPLEVDTEVRIEVDLAAERPSLDELTEFAVRNNPKMAASDLRLRQSKIRYSIARGRYTPSVSVGGGYSTSFFKNMSSDTVYPSFKDQFKDNRSYYFSASLSIPIFSGLYRRTAVHRARNNMRIAELENIETARTLRNEIAQTLQQVQGYGKQYVQAGKKVNAAQLAYRATEHKFEQGLVDPIELQTSANLLLQAKSERLNARLQYIIQSRMADYYNGQPLIR